MTRDDIPETLMRAALPLIANGEWARAAESLERAASLHKAAGRSMDEARCLQLAATLQRMSGDAGASRRLGERARAAAPEDLPLLVANLAERATAEAALGRHEQAVEGFGACLDKAVEGGLGPNGRIALLRWRAASLIAMGSLAAADADFATACGLADPRIAGFLRTEQAALLLDAGHAAAAARVLPSADQPDAQLRAEILVQRARLARFADDHAGAAAHATAARAAALEAVAPVPYFAASVELAQAMDGQDRREKAYAALTTAWGSLSDLLGCDVARSWVEPCLFALRLRWGDAGFAAVKNRHDARRRAELGRPSP